MNNLSFVSFKGNGESAGVPAYSTSVKSASCPPNQPECDSVNFKSNAYVKEEKKHSFLKGMIGFAGTAALVVGGLAYAHKSNAIGKLSDGWFKNIAKKAEPLAKGCYDFCTNAKTKCSECWDKVVKFFKKD